MLTKKLIIKPLSFHGQKHKISTDFFFYLLNNYLTKWRMYFTSLCKWWIFFFFFCRTIGYVYTLIMCPMKNIILYHRYEIKILNKSTYEIYHSYGGVELGGGKQGLGPTKYFNFFII